MAQIPVRLNTQAMSFPLLSELAGQTVIVGERDITYVPGVSTDGEVPQDRGVPGVIYAHNVMPSVYGWQSVGYESQVPGIEGDVVFEDIQLIQGATVAEDNPPAASNLRTYIAKVISGSDATLYALDRDTQTWQAISNSPTFPAGRPVFVAHINGFSYIMVSRQQNYVYNIATNTLIERPLNTLTMSNIRGIVSASGYLLAWTQSRVVWSSVTDPEDFEPSDISGAGGGAVQEAQGPIVACVPTVLGFIIYTEVNAVSVTYSGNENFPFNFKAIPSVGGIFDHRLVSEETANGYHYAYTTNGIQRITHNQSATLLPDLTDFIGGNRFEDFNEETGQLTVQILSQLMNRRLSLVANRYLIISYAAQSTGTYTHALVVDMSQQRYGKLKIPHEKVLEYRSIFSGTNLDARGSIAFLGPDGEVSTVNFNLDCEETKGVMLLGKLQFIRQRMLQLQEVEVENVCPSGNFALKDFPSMDGKTFDPGIEGFLNPADAGKSNKRYFFNNVAKNHTLVFQGAFNLVTIIAHFNVHGRV